MIMQMDNAIGHERELIRREEIPNGAILQQLLQNNTHFVSFLIVVLYSETEKCFGKRLFGNVHDIN